MCVPLKLQCMNVTRSILCNNYLFVWRQWSPRGIDDCHIDLFFTLHILMVRAMTQWLEDRNPHVMLRLSVFCSWAPACRLLEGPAASAIFLWTSPLDTLTLGSSNDWISVSERRRWCNQLDYHVIHLPFFFCSLLSSTDTSAVSCHIPTSSSHPLFSRRLTLR